MAFLAKTASTLCLFVSLIYFAPSNCSKILLYPFGHCFNSHFLNFEELGTILASKNHDVYVLVGDSYNSFPSFSPTLQRLTFPVDREFTPVCEHNTIDYMLYTPIQKQYDDLIKTFINYCDTMLSNKALMNRLKTERFDLFITETLDPCGRILADYLDIPFIPVITTGLGHPGDLSPRPPSYVPSVLTNFLPNMTFWQRLQNVAMKLFHDALPVLVGFDRPFELMKLKYGFNTSLRLSETFRRASIKLVNTDVAFEFPSPIEPDTILVGGYAMRQAKPLEGRFREFVEGAGPAGVIIITFGTLVTRFDDHWTNMLAEVFRKLPQRVIWRYEGEPHITMPDNVMLVNWMPQVDLIAHPSVKVVVSHCGLNGAMEIGYHGKPVLALPIRGDQFGNAGKLVDYFEVGLKLDVHSITQEQLLATLQRLLNEPKFSSNARILSQRIREKPTSPRDTLTFWIDYTLRHGGAYHLRSVANSLTWYQYLCLDVFAVLALAFSLAVILVTQIIRRTARFLAMKAKLKSD